MPASWPPGDPLLQGLSGPGYLGVVGLHRDIELFQLLRQAVPGFSFAQPCQLVLALLQLLLELVLAAGLAELPRPAFLLQNHLA